MVEQAGELVGDRLALHGLVQIDVFHGNCGLAGQIGEQLALRPARTGGRRGRRTRSPARGRRPRWRDSGAASALAPPMLDLRDLAGVHHGRLGGVQRAVVGLGLAACGRPPPSARRRAGASSRARRRRRRRRPRSARRSRARRRGRGRARTTRPRGGSPPAGGRAPCAGPPARASSWRAIELNSLPSAANSSLPSAGTVTLKSPRPSRCAACSSRWTSLGERAADDHREDERQREERRS